MKKDIVDIVEKKKKKRNTSNLIAILSYSE